MASISPQKDEEGHMYNGRHKHKLCSYEGLSVYTCSGCKEYGANVGFKCHICPDFIVHEACAELSDDYVHPFYGHFPLQFGRKTDLRRHCDACGEVIRGFVFKSRSAHLRFHPLCLGLPPLLNYGGHKVHRLKLITDKDGKYCCTQCNKMISDWRYQCEETTCRLSIDFNCAKVDLSRAFGSWDCQGCAPQSQQTRFEKTLEFGYVCGWKSGGGNVSALIVAATI